MLLLTQTDGSSDFSGTGVPFKKSANPDAPSTSALYARDWSKDGVGLLPRAGDEFMIMRHSDGDFVVMSLKQWCPGESWESTSQGACGGSGHPGYGQGSVTRGTSQTSLGDMYFNGCSHGGNCASGGGDGVGFSTHGQWANGPNNCYGGCFNGQSNGGSPFYWAGSPAAPDKLSYFFREG